MDKLSLNNLDTTNISTEELTVLKALRPYVGHCLTLNHDINNPLGGIIGYCEFMLLDAEQLTENQRKYVMQIAACADRIKRIIEALCEEKIALAEGIDLSSITTAYKKIARPLE